MPRRANKKKQEIIVNAQVRVHEKWSGDNWNGGSYGHALYLILPDSLYVRSVRQKEDLQIQIKTDINKMNNVQNEFIEEVFLEMEVAENQDWRRESGLLQPGKTCCALGYDQAHLGRRGIPGVPLSQDRSEEGNVDNESASSIVWRLWFCCARGYPPNEGMAR